MGINKEKYVGVNVGESWQKLRSVANGEANGNRSVSQKLTCYYGVSCSLVGNPARWLDCSVVLRLKPMICSILAISFYCLFGYCENA